MPNIEEMNPVLSTNVSTHEGEDGEVAVKIKIYRKEGETDNIFVGTYKEAERTFEKKAKSQNYFGKISGFAIPEKVLEILRRNMCEKIVIKEKEGEEHIRTLVSPIEYWFDEDRMRKYQQTNEVGEPVYEKQIVLPEHYMTVTIDNRKKTQRQVILEGY